jgi:hypothetical protein
MISRHKTPLPVGSLPPLRDQRFAVTISLSHHVTASEPTIETSRVITYEGEGETRSKGDNLEEVRLARLFDLGGRTWWEKLRA